MSCFSVLGVSEGASPEECKRAYRRLCRKYHPDNGGDIEMYERVQKAYEQSKAYKPLGKKMLRHQTLFTYCF